MKEYILKYSFKSTFPVSLKRTYTEGRNYYEGHNNDFCNYSNTEILIRVVKAFYN